MTRSFVSIIGLVAIVLNTASISYADAQSQVAAANCSHLLSERNAEYEALKVALRNKEGYAKLLALTETTDAAVADEWLRNYTIAVGNDHAHLQELGISSAETQHIKQQLKVDEAGLEFWRAKRTEMVGGGVLHIGGGEAYVRHLEAEVSKADKEYEYRQQQVVFLDRQWAECTGQAHTETTGCSASNPVGTWNWWNGATVMFYANGGARAINPNVSGSWQRTSANSYHVHWAHTDDYFTISRDGRSMSGTFDGKPGRSTRNC